MFYFCGTWQRLDNKYAAPARLDPTIIENRITEFTAATRSKQKVSIKTRALRNSNSDSEYKA